MLENSESIIRKYNPVKFEQMYKMHERRKKFILDHTDCNSIEKEAQIRCNFVRLCMSCFMDLFRKECSYILQAKDEEAEKEILKTFRDYLNTDVMDRRFFNVANNYIFPHTIIFCRDSIYGNYNALCAEREFELIEKALKFGRQVLNMADKKEDNIVSDEAKEKNMIK